MNLRTLALAALIPAGLFLRHEYADAKMAASTSVQVTPDLAFSITHNSMHFRQDIIDWVQSGQSKGRFGSNSFYRSLGSAKVPAAMTLGGAAIGAGDWKLAVKIPGDDVKKYILEFKQETTVVDVALDMQGGNDSEDHLLLALTPRGGALSKDFELKVFYGDMKATVAGSFAATAAAPSAGK